MDDEGTEVNPGTTARAASETNLKHMLFLTTAVVVAIVTAFTVTKLFLTPVPEGANIQNEAAVIESQNAQPQPEPEVNRPGHLLVKFAPGVNKASQQALISQIKGEEVERIKGIEVALVKVPEQARDSLIAALNKNPQIDFAELDSLHQILYTPNDPALSAQWHHSNIASAVAWEAYRGTDAVTVAIADTGLYTAHADLADSVVGTYNVVDGTSDVTDNHGHGSNVAGVAAAVGGNGVGVAGVSYASPIYSIKVSNLDSGSAYTSDLAKAIQYAADNNIRIINLSYDSCDSPTVKTAADYMEAKQGLVFLGAGNNGQVETYPAESSLVCVSATDASNNLTSWSSQGQHVDFAMPGSAIYTTNKTGGYNSVSGTSFSSPMMAGSAALLLSINPDLSPFEVKEIFQQSATDLGEPGWDEKYGWGLVNLGAAVAMAASGTDPNTDTGLPVASIISPQEGDVISGNFEMVVEATDDSGVIDKVDMTMTAVDVSSGFQSAGSSDSIEPYTSFFYTGGIPDGQYILEAVATDEAGNESAPARITVEVLNEDDTEAPTVTVITPIEGEVLPSRGSFTISAEASDNVGVERLTIMFDGNVHAVCDQSSTCEASISIKGLDSGAHEVQVSALDAKFNRTDEYVSVTVGSKGGGKPSTDDGSTDGGSTNPNKGKKR